MRAARVTIITIGRKRIRCDGVGSGDDWKPCFQSSEIKHKVDIGDGQFVEGRGLYVVEQDGKEALCPTCKGDGYYDNPEPEPKKGDLHSDGGYALKQRWL